MRGAPELVRRYGLVNAADRIRHAPAHRYAAWLWAWSRCRDGASAPPTGQRPWDARHGRDSVMFRVGSRKAR